MKSASTLVVLFLAGAAIAQADTLSNAWSGVSGDKANLSAFAFRADAGTYPASVDPLGSLPPATTFSLNSLTLYRPNDTTTPNFGTGTRQLTDANTPVFIDIYTAMPTAGTFSGYVGSSSSSVVWSGTTANTPYTLNFTGITLDSSTKYWFVFSEDNLDGDVSNFRLYVNTSGADTAAGSGKGYLVGDTAQALAQNGVVQDWGMAYTVDFTAIPEPSAVVLGLIGLGALTLLRFRRR